MRPRLTSHRVGLGLLLAAACLWSFSCQDDDKSAELACPQLYNGCPDLVPSYANEVAPIIEAHCGQCHSRQNPGGPWALDNPSDIGDWASSIQADLRDCLMPPPDTDVPLSAVDRQTLYVWMACGSPDN